MKILFLMIKYELCRLAEYKEKILLNHIFFALIIFLEYSVYSAFLHKEGYRLILYLLVSTNLSSCLLTFRFPKFIYSLRKGEIVKYFTFPKSVWFIIVLEDISESVTLLIENSILLIGALLLSKASPLLSIEFILSVLLSICLGVLISESFYSLTFVLNNYSASKTLLSGISSMFAGGIIPLIYLPDLFVKISYATPFALLIDGPVNILIDGNLNIIPLQIIWCIVFGLISYFLITSLYKNVSVFGG